VAEKRLTIENAEPLLLFGFNDVYLRRIEAAFPDTQITARGTTVLLRGEPERLARIEMVLSELVVLLNRNGNLTENDVETVLALTALGDGERPSAAIGARDAILFTPGGGIVRAKTPGQQRLVEKARGNDIVFAIGPAGTGKCVAADTLVLTDRGMVEIGSLAPHVTGAGDHVPLACTVHGLDGAEAASHFYDGGQAETLRVTTRRGYEIEVTPEHPLLVLSEAGTLEWRRADALRTGDVVALQRGQRFFGQRTHVGFRTERTGPHDTATRPLALDDLDPDLAYVVGLLVGDGCLTQARAVRFTSADPELRAAFEGMARRFGLHVTPNGPYDLQIGSRPLRDLLVHLGCSTGTAATKRIPPAILQAPEPVVVAFLQGLFDADGSVEKRDGAVTFSTVSERLAREVQVVLLNLGVMATRSVKHGRYEGRPHASWLLTMAGAEAARFDVRVGFRLERKRARRRLAALANPNLDVVPHVAPWVDAAVRLTTLTRALHKRFYDYRIGRRAPSYAALGALVQTLEAHGAAGEALAHLNGLLARQLAFVEVTALTASRARVLDLTVPGTHSFVAGGFVCHNTYTAVALAVAALKSRQAKKIVLARPAVEAGERLGFLPGDLKDKIDPYLRPLYDALEDMMPRERLAASLQDGTIEIAPLAFMRGRTLNAAFVILDEAQNATVPQMKMFLTRLGAGSRAIVTGDATQTDLPTREMSGLAHARSILEGIEGIAVIEFDRSDVVRHRLVKDIIEAYERDGMMGEGG
jgi:phosphate starvation-inducible protein PhoH